MNSSVVIPLLFTDFRNVLTVQSPQTEKLKPIKNMRSNCTEITRQCLKSLGFVDPPDYLTE